LYFAGARLASYYPVSIVVHSMALNVTVQSYAGRLDYGLIACRRALPDITDLGDYLLAEHQVLLAKAHEKLAEAAPDEVEVHATKPAPETSQPQPKRKRTAVTRRAKATA
jgi:hypothetical protein